jgi:hypothetical protein
MLVKYAVGLAVVIVACGLPIAAEPWLNSRRVLDEMVLRPGAILVPQLCLSAAIYSLAFLAGCLVRRTAQAAMLGLAAMLLVYFLPMVVAPLGWLALGNVSGVFDNGVPAGRMMGFAGGMLGIAGVALLAALGAVAWEWRIESRREMMYGSVSAALLILVATVGISAGTDLPILQEVSLPAEEVVYDMGLVDGRVVVAVEVPPPIKDHDWLWKHYIVTVTGAGMQMKQDQGSDVAGAGPIGWRRVELGGVRYQLGFERKVVARDTEGRPLDICRWHLETRNLAAGTGTDWSIWPIGFESEAGKNNAYDDAHLYLWKDHLYLIGPRLIVCDVSEAGKPRVILDRSWAYRPQWVEFGEQELTIALPPLPGVGAEQRLAAAMVGQEAFDGEVLCGMAQGAQDRLCEYRLWSLTEDRATFRLVGQYERSLLQRTLLPRLFGGLRLENGLLYLETGLNDTRYFYVFDTRGSMPMRLVGHIAPAWNPAITPRGWENTSICPLPDGRAVVGQGNKIWLTGAPILQSKILQSTR